MTGSRTYRQQIRPPLPLPAFLVVLLAALIVSGPGLSAASLQATPASTPGATPGATPEASASAERVILFSADGMRPDLVERYASEGAMPTIAELMENGVTGKNGMVQAFPPNTGVGWHTLATGTYPGEHGSTNNTFHRTGEADFGSSSSAYEPGILQADHIAQAAERAGKTVVAVEWVGARGLDPALQGPVVDFRSFFSDRGVLTNYDLPGEQADRFGVTNQRVDLQPAEGWSNVPESFSPAMEQTLTLTNTAFPVEDNVDRAYLLYIYDSTDDGETNYDRVLVVPGSTMASGAPAPTLAQATPGDAGPAQATASPAAATKDGDNMVADLAAGDWADIKVSLTGERDGETAGFYLKALDIAPDLSEFRLYYTSIARANASYAGCDDDACADFAETLAHDFPTATAADFAPLEARIIDEETYVEQGLLWQDAHQAYLRYILEDLGVEPDLLLLGVPVTDEFSHQFLGLLTETVNGAANPFYDDLEGDGSPDGRVEAREGYIQSAYELADETLGLAKELIDGEEATFVVSDHGFAPAYYAVNAGLVLQQAGVVEQEQTANCRTSEPIVSQDATPGPEAPPGPAAKACWAGGTAQIYLNIMDRDPTGVIPEEEVDAVTERIVSAFEGITDPDNPDASVVAEVFLKEELRDVQGSDSLHPTRSGDIVVVLNPPYQFDAAKPGELIAPSEFFGQHGFLPDLVDLDSNVNMHATFIAAGPGIVDAEQPIADMRAIDIAPTVSFLLDIPGPQDARGQIRYDLLEGGENLREVTILNVSDYHGQIVPLFLSADDLDDEGAENPSFGAGGAAYLKPWFDLYRAAAPGTVITIAGGDSIGATPPISAYFGDEPTIELMNAMGFDADALGNHNFDVSAEYQTETIAALAEFPYLSVNVLDDEGNTAGDDKTLVIEVDGIQLGLIGFSNPDIPDLTRPGALGPYHVEDPLPLVNEAAAELRAEGVEAIVAFGHLGATDAGGPAPSGRLIDLADGVEGVDAVVGDHTDFSLIDLRPNGVLVTENRSKGAEFTRLRLVIDVDTGEVVYKTADQHVPWNIGVTPDAGIQSRLDELNEELQPILGTVIGTSSTAIPRADSCGMETGRTCESLAGNVVADAIRATYEEADFVITNSGGLRADLTCPAEDSADDFCPADAPANAITRGTVLGVLPFGNVVATAEISGAELKTYLEHSVEAMPEPAGSFAQVSGLCFTYDISSEPGNRVKSVVRQAEDGSCTGEAVDLSESATYTIATNDFMAAGGDGYPDISARATTREVMANVVADYIEDQGAIDPAIQGRIVCEGDGCPETT
ncbi:MAG TPA: alkaline phosphatase family protein [Thermomicrobiales bacterium]|nr:alkaline phosphatase family protein [Thermomicrobiales bacterium]